MAIKTFAFFAYILFAGYVLYGEIGLNRYGTEQGALNRIDAAERAEIDALMQSEIVKLNLDAYKRRINGIDENSASMNTKNIRAIESRGSSVVPYNDKVLGNDSRIATIQAEQDEYISKVSAPILKKYEEQRTLARKDSNLVSLGFAMPCAALFLCLFSAWVYPPRTLFKENRGLQGSYVAQFMSCVITFDAVLIQQGLLIKAIALSIGAFVSIPLGHYLAGLLWIQIQAEWAAWKTNRLSVTVLKRKENQSATLTRTTTTTQEHKITLESIPDDFEKAIELIVSERKLGNGTGLGVMVAQKFGKSEAWVSKSVKRLLESGETH